MFEPAIGDLVIYPGLIHANSASLEDIKKVLNDTCVMVEKGDNPEAWIAEMAENTTKVALDAVLAKNGLNVNRTNAKKGKIQQMYDYLERKIDN